jgi:hypothetical protein
MLPINPNVPFPIRTRRSTGSLGTGTAVRAFVVSVPYARTILPNLITAFVFSAHTPCFTLLINPSLLPGPGR